MVQPPQNSLIALDCPYQVSLAGAYDSDAASTLLCRQLFDVTDDSRTSGRRLDLTHQKSRIASHRATWFEDCAPRNFCLRSVWLASHSRQLSLVELANPALLELLARRLGTLRFILFCGFDGRDFDDLTLVRRF